MALDVPQGRIELKVLFETLREEELKLHRLSASVVEDDFVSVKLIVN